jgi:Ca2+-binding RTX toxin-like protein
MGGMGNDNILGGAGWDTLSYAAAPGGVTVDLGTSPQGASGGAGVDAMLGIEHAVGSPYADALYGNAIGNTLQGGAGNDQLFGRAGNDFLRGGDGDDRIVGSDGFDHCVDTAGDNSLDGCEAFD